VGCRAVRINRGAKMPPPAQFSGVRVQENCS
jgi:hypothetical protein